MPAIDEPAAPIPSARSGCPVCGETCLRKLFNKFGCAVLGCRGCGLQLLHPQPGDNVLAEVYRAGYFLGAPTPEEDKRVQRMKRATGALYAERLAERLPGRGRVLELGCGRGEFLMEAQARGFDGHGIEFSRDAAAVANQRLPGERVRVGTIEDAPHPPGTFDGGRRRRHRARADPMAFLRRAHGLLRPGECCPGLALDSLSARPRPALIVQGRAPLFQLPTCAPPERATGHRDVAQRQG
jgi:SAM-dependent methyltransferase